MEKNSKNIRKIFLTIILLVTVILGIKNISKAVNNDTGLKSLSVEPSNYELVQDEENKAIYRVKVNNNVTSIKVNAVPNNSNAKVSVEGNESLNIGTNEVTVKITAENGQSSEYKIYVRRASTPISEETIIPNVQETVENNNANKIEQSGNENEGAKNETIINETIENTEENLESNNELNDIQNIEQNNENKEIDTPILDKKSNNNFVFYIIIFAILIILIIICVIVKNKNKASHSKH